MKVQNVDSSVLSAIGYDAETETLEVRFRTGRIYRYHHVPKRIHTHLLTRIIHEEQQ